MHLGTFFTALSYLTGMAVFYWSARDRQFPPQKILLLSTSGLIGGVIGAKLIRWLMDWQAFSNNPGAILNPQLGGRTIIGGIILGWVAVELAKIAIGIKRSTGDSFALALLAGEAVGRIGCFFNTCCYGIPTNVPWAVFQHDAWRHPTQLYSCVVCLAILTVLLYLRKKMPHEGDLFRVYLLLYGSSRFVLEFWRERTNVYWGLSLAQWICLEMMVAMLITGIILNILRLKEKERGTAIGD